MLNLRPRLWASLFVLVAVGCGDNADAPPTAECGDGVVDPGEACDDGDGNSDTLPDACRLDCAQPICGDDVVDAGEECDDGPANGEQLCTTACKLKPPTCGDGVVNAGEECDDGAANSDTTPNACRTSCDHAACGDSVLDNGESCDNGAANSNTAANACRTTCKAASCGDGVIDSAETCDNGANNSNTAANACRTTCVPATCGDGVIDTGETCDDGANNNNSAPNACRTTCVPATCGDGVVDTGETCDDGANNSNSAPNACRTTCVPATCGDGVIDTGETCDDGANNSNSAPNACRTTCVPATCGDGVVDTGETCDDGANNSNSAPNACRTTCVPATCGDGAIDNGEECDNGSANGDNQSCSAGCELTLCGNGALDAGELCDDGAANSDTAANACRTNCMPAKCGDGVVDSSETCDNGAANSDTAANACRTTCNVASCGDGVIDTSETCDNGAANSNTMANACRTTCVPATCGDGVIDTGETCDDGAANSNTVANACRTTCVPATCGDGVVDSGEACDAGPANSDTAANACRMTCVAAMCGDGVIDSGEACDAGAANDDTSDTCRTTCKAPACGDGIVDLGAGEHCDLGAANSDASGSTCFTTCKGLWKFVSMPDFLGYDIGDVSTLTSAVNSTNTYHEDAINFVLDSIAFEDPDFVLVAGNLVGGRWYSDTDNAGVFGPVSTLADKQAAVALAADTYYPQWLKRFEDRDIPVHAAIGDRDIGDYVDSTDNPWAITDERSHLVDDYKNAFAKHLTKLPSGVSRYVDRPVGTDFANTAYAFRHKNMLVLSADVFQFQDGTTLGPQGSVALNVTTDQIAWIDQVFTAAAADPTIEYLVVQGNVPVIKPVRFQASSNLGLDGGTASAFWQALAAAGVDLYLSGEVHAMSSSGADGVEQVCHGGLMGSANARTVSYLVGSVYPDRIELELKWIDIGYNPMNAAELWQTGSNRPRAELYLDEANGFTTAGTMVIDHSGLMPVVRDRTGYFLRFQEQPAPGLLVHLPLDAAQGGRTANLGFSTALNRGDLTGGTLAAGKLGNALTLAASERVVAGASQLRSTWPRTVSVWVKPKPGATGEATTGLSTVLTFGRNSSGGKWDVDIDHTNGGVVELGINGGRTNGALSPAVSVTDGAWHHIAMVLPDGATTLGAVKIYVDGVAITATASNAAINTAGEVPDQSLTERRLILGHSANNDGFQQYLGEMDDVAIWSRGFSAIEVKALVSLANTAGLAYDAGQVDKLLTAFAAQRNVTIGLRTWTYQASGLTGTAGVVVQPVAGTYQLNLGGGAGLVSP